MAARALYRPVMARNLTKEERTAREEASSRIRAIAESLGVEWYGPSFLATVAHFFLIDDHGHVDTYKTEKGARCLPRNRRDTPYILVNLDTGEQKKMFFDREAGDVRTIPLPPVQI